RVEAGRRRGRAGTAWPEGIAARRRQFRRTRWRRAERCRVKWGRAAQEALKKRTGRIVAPASGYGWNQGPAGGEDSERDLSRDALRRLGREDRYPHHGPSSVHFAVALRAGGRTRPSAHFV